MASYPEHSQRFTEAEIGRLIQRATELHEAEDAGSGEPALDLADIEHIANEMGIPARYVRRAASEMRAQGADQARRGLFGAPHVLTQVRSADHELTDDEWQQIVLELRQSLGSTGSVSELGSMREWEKGLEDAGWVIEKTRVTARPEDDGTTIRLEKSYGGFARMTYILSFIAGLGLTGIALDGMGLSDLVAFSIAGGGGVGGLAAARAGIAVWSQRQKQRLTGIADRIMEIAGATPERSAKAAAPAGGQIDLPDLDDQEVEGASMAVTRGRERT